MALKMRIETGPPHSSSMSPSSLSSPSSSSSSSSSLSLLSALALSLQCPLCLCLFTRPVTLPCAHHFCRRCIRQRSSDVVCPHPSRCGRPFWPGDVQHNVALEGIVVAFGTMRDAITQPHQNDVNTTSTTSSHTNHVPSPLTLRQREGDVASSDEDGGEEEQDEGHEDRKSQRRHRASSRRSTGKRVSTSPSDSLSAPRQPQRGRSRGKENHLPTSSPSSSSSSSSRAVKGAGTGRRSRGSAAQSRAVDGGEEEKEVDKQQPAQPRQRRRSGREEEQEEGGDEPPSIDSLLIDPSAATRSRQIVREDEGGAWLSGLFQAPYRPTSPSSAPLSPPRSASPAARMQLDEMREEQPQPPSSVMVRDDDLLAEGVSRAALEPPATLPRSLSPSAPLPRSPSTDCPSPCPPLSSSVVVVPPSSADVVVLMTAVGKESVAELKTQVGRLGGLVVNRFTPAVTHVVSPVSGNVRHGEEERLTKRTIKLLLAILAGRWIVDVEWIRRSAEEGRWVEEEEHEVKGDLVVGAAQGPRRGRKAARNRATSEPPLLLSPLPSPSSSSSSSSLLLSSFVFVVLCPLSPLCPSLSDLQSLCTASGAEWRAPLDCQQLDPTTPSSSQHSTVHDVVRWSEELVAEQASSRHLVILCRPDLSSHLSSAASDVTAFATLSLLSSLSPLLLSSSPSSSRRPPLSLVNLYWLLDSVSAYEVKHWKGVRQYDSSTLAIAQHNAQST